jgi:hypothetical protein
MEKKYISQIRLILDKIPIPRGISMRNYMMEKFALSKESAYRRLRGEIPFSFDEVASMSVDLGFSIDEIVEKATESNIYDKSALFDGGNGFLKMLQDYQHFIQSLVESPIEILFSMNRLHLFFLIEYDSLFEWFYRKWMYLTEPVSVRQTVSTRVISENIQHIRQELINQIKGLGKIDFIIHKDFFLTPVNEIQYDYQRKLISKEEMLRMKEEMALLLKKLESKMADENDKYDFYLSNLDVETNSICACHGQYFNSLFWLYPLKIVIINNYKLCREHIRWLKSIKESSALISHSNEMIRMDFFERQNKYVEQM